MKTNRRTNPDFLNGVPELLILQLLARQPMHGYDLVQSIRLRTGSELEFGEGCIYPILHRLEREGHLASARTDVRGRPRVTYRVTTQGKQRLSANVSAWERVVAAVRTVLEGGERGQLIQS